ncbi:hypothetical protein TgHK011_006041 [Trichoderma gracile]|nr:hypothetical protein TgHK011_006041 [Trichoderma gracile]
MDGLPQRPEADASLAFLQGLDEERPLSKKLTGSQRPLAPSEAGSSSTMDHPNAVDRRRKRMAVSASSEDGAAKRLKIASTDQDVVVVGTTRPSRYDISQHVRAEVWQHIFTLVPPRSLGKLMCVNRLFHKYLDPTSSFKVSAPDSDLPSLLPKLAPNNIWRASRHSHWPSMPSPLSGRSELDMWRFACSRSCQFCGRVDETDYAGDPLPWSRGPGNNTVTHVFQFFVTSCGQCLVKNSVKVSAIPSRPWVGGAFTTCWLTWSFTGSRSAIVSVDSFVHRSWGSHGLYYGWLECRLSSNHAEFAITDWCSTHESVLACSAGEISSRI